VIRTLKFMAPNGNVDLGYCPQLTSSTPQSPAYHRQRRVTNRVLFVKRVRRRGPSRKPCRRLLC